MNWWHSAPAWCAALILSPTALVCGAAARPSTMPDRGEIRGLKLGLQAEAMNALDGFGALACGSNGGPPRQPLDDWAEFRKCRPEENGLREVAARFDDEDEYIGKAIDDPLYAGRKTGTRVSGHPVILSVLFDDHGILRGLRIVSDPRGTIIERRVAHMLRYAVVGRYDPDGWTCTDAPPAAGETSVGGVFVKQRCEKSTPERHLILQAQFLRKPGQSDIDPATGEYRSGQFESWTRFELLDPSYLKR